MMLWPLDAIISASGGSVTGRPKNNGGGSASASGTHIIFGTDGASGDQNWQASGVSIDTRSLEIGDLFIALEGTRFDGHDYISDAERKGAVAAITHKPVATTLPTIQVDDSFEALNRLALASRQRGQAKIIAITGSVGKTSTRHIIAEMLGGHAKTHAAHGNYNNHIGVPLCLARMPIDSQYGVFELGMNHAGEIAHLTAMVQPDYAIITRIGTSHLGNFAGVEGVAEAKAEIFEGLVQGGVAILNADDDFTPMLADKARDAGASRIITIGTNPDADARIISTEQGAEGFTAEVVLGGTSITVRLGMHAPHHIFGAVAGLVIAGCEGLPLDKSLQALARITDLAGRGKQHHLTHQRIGRLTLIDDSYNASPESMAAGIRHLATSPIGGRRVAILGDMLELGEHSDALHRDLAEVLTANPPSLLMCLGEGMAVLAQALSATSIHIHQADSLEEILALSETHLHDGDLILIKGSNSMGLALLVESLLAQNGGANAA